MNVADYHYHSLIEQVLNYGDLIETRNHEAYSLISSDTIVFVETPLVTLRKTAWKKALREMEWFLSGDPKCPEELLDWWDGQLNIDGDYLLGYGEQLRNHGSTETRRGYDQISALIQGLIAHPYSRRHIITTWHPWDMNHITAVNGNMKTPSCCHMTVNQYFVRDGKLSARTYQRSCDVLLGLIHNWIQHWGLLLWLASQTNLEVGSLIYNIGDAHIYREESHLAVADAILDAGANSFSHRVNPKLVYRGEGDFKASDFELEGFVDAPVSRIRPTLL